MYRKGIVTAAVAALLSIPLAPIPPERVARSFRPFDIGGRFDAEAVFAARGWNDGEHGSSFALAMQVVAFMVSTRTGSGAIDRSSGIA